jgi:hypothetical protein
VVKGKHAGLSEEGVNAIRVGRRRIGRIAVTVATSAGLIPRPEGNRYGGGRTKFG